MTIEDNMNTLILSRQMNVTHDFLVNIAESVFNLSPDIHGVHELDTHSVNIMKSMCDPVFISQFISQHKVSKTKLFTDNRKLSSFETWVKDVDLTGMSTTEIELIAAGGPYTGLKQVSRLMRANGYESKIVYLGNDKQGRRWFKVDEPDIKSAKAKVKHKSDISFL